MNKEKIYIAGKYTGRLRIREYKAQLIAMGYEVLSKWLDQHEGDYDTITNDELQILAVRDIEEVTQATVFIIDTIDQTTTAGREVELGIAIAQYKKIYVVGPLRNLFHSIYPRFDSWNNLIKELSNE